MALFWLSDEAWAAIQPHLPKNQPGARRVDDRRVISGIVHVLKVGCRWCDCPADYGPSTTIYNRFNRWSRRGFWLELLAALVDAGVVTKSTAIDSTYVKIQRAAFGANVWLAPSASGLCLMFCAVCENVSGLSTRGRWPRWRSARPGPHKGAGIECHFKP